MKNTHSNFIQFISKLWFIFYNTYLNERGGGGIKIFHMNAMKVLANCCQHAGRVTNQCLTWEFPKLSLDFSQKQLHQPVKDLKAFRRKSLNAIPCLKCNPSQQRLVWGLPVPNPWQILKWKNISSFCQKCIA